MSSSGEILSLLNKDNEEQRQEQQNLLRKKIEETGDNLRNYNSWKYLCQFRPAIDGILSNKTLAAKFDEKTLNIFRQMQKHIPEKKGGYGYGVRGVEAIVPYGDMYTDFLKTLEENLPEIRAALVRALKKEEDDLNARQKTWAASRDEHPKNLAQAKENLDTIDKFIDTIYRNQNKALKTAAKAVDHLVTTINPNDLEHAITKHLSKNERAINETTPQKQGSGWGRLTAMVSSEFKPQMTTSLASVRTYAHSKHLKATEIRFGTQGQRHHGKERVAPLFKLWLEVQQRRHVDTYKNKHNGAEPSGADAITHIYFNNLGVDRNDWEGKKESRLSDALHRLEEEHPNVAVISIPADKGIMSKSMLSKEGTVTKERAKKILLEIATRGKDGEKLSEIDDDKRDFYISDKIKDLLGQGKDGGYDELIEHLVNESFTELGLKSKADLSYSELQGVFFYFAKFKLTNHIIDTLNPDSFNMSCKDAIDRGGVSSAYYNLMKSIEFGEPMTKAEFNEALHAAPTLVKGRGMNHHAQIIWNAVDVYLQNPENKAPAWLSDWRFENCPKDKARASLTKTIDSSLENLKAKLADEQKKNHQQNIPILEKAIETLQATRALIDDETTKASAYSLLYQASLQTESLANKAIAFNENPNDAPAREAFVKASERYGRLQDKADKHYSKLGKVLGQFFKWLFNAKSFNHDKKAKDVVNAHGAMKAKLDELKSKDESASVDQKIPAVQTTSNP